MKARKAELAQANKPTPNLELKAKIKEQGDLVRKLKADKAAKEVIDDAIERLKALELQLQPNSEQAGRKLILKTTKGFFKIYLLQIQIQLLPLTCLKQQK